MNGMRMRGILLRFLAVCNVIVLAVIAFYGLSSRVQISQESKQLIRLLENRDVICEKQVYRQLLEEKRAFTIRTDPAQQNELSHQLLGESSEFGTQNGGSIEWVGERGQLSWSADGMVSGTVSFGDSAPQSAQDAEKLIYNVLKKSGLNMKQLAVLGEDADGEGYNVRVQQGVEGRNLEGCELRFGFSADGKTAVSGKWCFGEPEEAQFSALESGTPADIVLATLRCSTAIGSIEDARQIYVLANKSGGRFIVTPCWRMTTDIGEYIIDPITLQAVDPSYTEVNENWSAAESSEVDESTDTIVYPNGENAIASQTHSDTGISQITDPNAIPGIVSPSEGDTMLPADGDQTGTTGIVGGPTDGTVGADGSTNIGDEQIFDDGNDWNTSDEDPELPDENGVFG